jgi:DNA-binding CsgD family transcriptional regulator
MERPTRVGEILMTIHPITDIANDINRAMEAFPQTFEHTLCRGAHLLSGMELKVAEMIGLGMTNKAMAEELFISPLTVRTHIKRVHAKCGIKGRPRLAIVLFNIWEKGLYMDAVKKREEIIAERKLAREKRKSVLKEMVY